MKQLTIFSGILLFMISCQKTEEPVNTSLQLNFTEYLSGDTIPEIAFDVTDEYGLNFSFSGSTNAYGNYDTSFIHAANSEFNLNLTDIVYYGQEQESAIITPGTHNTLNIRLVEYGFLGIVFNCGGTGDIIDPSYYLAEALSPSNPFYNNTKTRWTPIYSYGCGLTHYASVYPGDWVIEYSYRTNYSAPWTTMRDTVNVNPGDTTYYMITY